MDTNSFVLVPEGTYRCYVDEVRKGTTRAGDERWSFSLRVSDGQHAGKLAAWDSLVFSPRGRARVRMVFAAVHLPPPGEVDPSDFEGRSVMAKVRHVSYETLESVRVTRNEVPYDGYAAVPVPKEEPKKTPRAKRVAMFGEAVLQILQAHKEWGSDTTDAIGAEAARLGLGETDDEEGLFKVK